MAEVEAWARWTTAKPSWTKSSAWVAATAQRQNRRSWLVRRDRSGGFLAAGCHLRVVPLQTCSTSGTGSLVHEADWGAGQQTGQRFRDWAQGEQGILPCRAAEVRDEDDFGGAMFKQILDGGGDWRESGNRWSPTEFCRHRSG